MTSDDIVMILPRMEAQGLYDLLDGGLAPKPQSLLAAKPTPPLYVKLSTVFPTVYQALHAALNTEEETT